jgi:hypothetical protein
MPLAAFFLSLVQPILARIMVSLGFSMLSIVGMEALIGQMMASFTAAWGALPGNILALAGLAGIGEGLGIITGAIMTRVLIWQLTKSTRMIASNPG